MTTENREAIVRWNDAVVLEALRLINKFFPESKGFLTPETGISFWSFLDAMKLATFQADYSCDYFYIHGGPDLGLDQKGGFQGEHDLVFARLLAHAGFTPSGRCVIVPDTLGSRGWSSEPIKPIICDHKRAGERIAHLDLLFDHTHDSLFIFESGEALAVDHDQKFYWAKSTQNRYQKGELR